MAHARYPRGVQSRGGSGLPSFRLIPREERFFDLFVADAANVLDGARQLEAMLRTYDSPDKAAKKIREVEHRGDEISKDIGRRLEETFVTPFDREEIHALISNLDDILDLIEEVADTFVLYRIEAPTKTSVKQTALVVQCCETLHEALGNLRGFKDLDRFVVEIHRLENEGDRLARSAIAGLFDDGAKTIEVLKWKDIYTLLEETIDKCEDVAQLIERIVVKHA
jgi:predicted phosphate transport protein (TIGR00153 family)